MSAFEMWVVGGLFGIIGVLIWAIWILFNKRHDDHVSDTKERFNDADRHIGLLQSKTNDLRSDMSAVQTNISNHSDKFDEVISFLRRMEDKIDNWRERRT